MTITELRKKCEEIESQGKGEWLVVCPDAEFSFYPSDLMASTYVDEFTLYLLDDKDSRNNNSGI